jgi:hypothetical protein
MRLSKVLGRGALAAVLLTAVPGMLAAQDSTPSSGVFKTAQQMFDSCTSSEAADLEMCDSFIMGAHDMMKFYGDTGAGGSPICIPAGTQALVVRDTVIAYWRNDAAGLQYSAVSTIYNALVEAYPC